MKRRFRGDGAKIEGDYRYLLWRIWDASRPIVNVVGVNPSTADADRNDPTITRCIEFARRWECGGLLMTNLFAYRSSKTRALRDAVDPIGPKNDRFIRDASARAAFVVAAWGN